MLTGFYKNSCVTTTRRISPCRGPCSPALFPSTTEAVGATRLLTGRQSLNSFKPLFLSLSALSEVADKETRKTRKPCGQYCQSVRQHLRQKMDFCCKSGRVDERMRRARSCGAGGIGKARLFKLTNGRRLLLGGAERSNACFHGASLPFPMSLL